MTAQNVVESGRKTAVRTDVKANIARALLEALGKQCKAYCILSGYDRLPGHLETDIDFMVDQEDFERMPRILESVARKTGTRLFQAIDHELTGRAYFLGSLAGASLTIVQPDCAADYRHSGRLWLPAGEVLAARRLHPEGFWIPSTEHEFAYLLIKRLHLGSFNRDDGYRLHRLYVENRIECGRMIARFCRGPEGSSIVRMASANDWSAMYESPGSYRAALLRSQKETSWRRLRQLPQKASHRLKSIFRPAGCSVVVMGPEGYEKSLIVHAISREFSPSFRSVEYCRAPHRGPGSKPSHRGSVPGPSERARLASIAQIAGSWFEYWFRYLTRILPGIVGTQLVLSDHCLCDLVVGAEGKPNGRPDWLAAAAVRLSPKPGLVIVLDMGSESSGPHRPGIPMDVKMRHHSRLLDVAGSIPAAVVVQVAQSPEGAAHDAIEAVVNHMARRTGKRIGIRP